MAHYIVEGLRPNHTNTRSNANADRDTGDDGDIEDEGEWDGERTGRERRRKARKPWENTLSVCSHLPTSTCIFLPVVQERIRDHLKDLTKGRTATDADITYFDPTFGPCCDVEDFRLHLAGTPCNLWNKSATEVFMESFLEKYKLDYPPEYDGVVRMVGFKVHSTIAALIKRYRSTGPDGTVDPETRKQQNRQERKRKLFHRRHNMTWFYPLLQNQRPLLEELGPDGMSSDEERTVGATREYDIFVPAWRAPVVTAWLRVFDILYVRARRDGVFKDHRGSYPRTRVIEENAQVSTSIKFVSGLPLNAYNEDWLRRRVNVTNSVRPRPPVEYYHDPRVIE
ncbi:hypothetical protein BJ322DRAFT_1000864 [Thelephora terrestris]|uniref:Uncharacterized protein n=1 Tax=Thelephora terrestris TaxID=56493 RepID=A0A9P6H358_9AGAM|nr:hypothetical protein BJ322DRAFT_1014568 [Thelephora terrestris]KAF9789462.1 hypothetical protein BJ322DRAFT_1000864 [Thelephora terrestris]